jgi:hypothetical protein
MKTLTKSALSLAVGATLTGIGVAASPLANATDYGVSIAAYCAANVTSGTAAPSQATNINNRWDGWRCGTRTGLVGVDVAKACRQQVNPNAIAVTVNQTASGWRCRV